MGCCGVLCGYYGVLCGNVGVLQVTEWYCGLLLVTTGYWVVLGCTGEVNRGTGGIAGYCGILWVLESNREYCVALFGLATFFLQNLCYFLKGFTSVCLRISTRYKAIIIKNYFDS